jgi:signal transduction histidine kinase
VDRPARRLRLPRPGRPAAEAGGWRLGRWLWDPYFVLCYVVAVAMLAGHDGTTPARRVAVIGLFTLITICYWVLGRPAILAGDEGWPGWLFVAIVAVLFGVAVGFEQMSAFTLFAICPMVFFTLPLRYAIPVVTVLNLLPPVIGGVQTGSLDRFRDLLPTAVFGLSFGLLIGVYIERIVRQSAERAELIRELEASRAEVSRLSHQAGVDAERARLAGEIHDTLAQGFTSIITLLQAAESALGRDERQVRHRLDLALRTARENLSEARALVRASAPEALETGSLDEAVRRLVERTGEQLGVPADFHRAGPGLQLPTGVEVVLLRAAQEALSNVCRHAKASEVAVRLSYEDSAVGLTVCDDGVGFVQDGEPTGFGLPGMRKRVEQVGGSLRIATAPGAGTEVRVEVPV